MSQSINSILVKKSHVKELALLNFLYKKWEFLPWILEIVALALLHVTLAIVTAILTLEVGGLESSLEVHPNHTLKLRSHDILHLPILHFSCKISCSMAYFSPGIVWPRYYSFLLVIVLISSFSFPIFLTISKFLIWATHDTFKIRPYIHI